MQSGRVVRLTRVARRGSGRRPPKRLRCRRASGQRGRGGRCRAAGRRSSRSPHIALVRARGLDDPAINARPLPPTRMVLCVPRHHGLARETEVAPDTLDGERLLVPSSIGTPLAGAYNDGYADNLALTLTAPAPPAAAPPASSATARCRHADGRHAPGRRADADRAGAEPVQVPRGRDGRVDRRQAQPQAGRHQAHLHARPRRNCQLHDHSCAARRPQGQALCRRAAKAREGTQAVHPHEDPRHLHARVGRRTQQRPLHRPRARQGTPARELQADRTAKANDKPGKALRTGFTIGR